MSRRLICSRSDRLGDLILTLPALGLLKKALPAEKIGLHVSEYAAAVAEVALANGLCDFVIYQKASKEWVEIGGAPNNATDLLSFFHGPLVKELQAREKFTFSLSPRTKLSTLWTYTKSISQKRSRVEKSEMEYNLDLARAYLAARGVAAPDFNGLPQLKLPSDWPMPVKSSAKTAALFVNNGASAQNWPLEKYLEVGRNLTSQGFQVHYHYSGVNAEVLKKQLEADSSLTVKGPFAQLRDLLSYISGLDYLVASSTGPLHLGHALGVPVLGIYPREPKVQSFKRWRPHGYWHNAGVELIEF